MSREEPNPRELNARPAENAAPSDARPREDDLPPPLKSTEARLASLVPRADRLDRDRLMYLAGRESVVAGLGRATSGRRRRAWPAALSAVAGMAAGLLAMAMLRSAPSVVYVDRIVYRPVEEAVGGKVFPSSELPRSDAGHLATGPREMDTVPPFKPGLLTAFALGWPHGDTGVRAPTSLAYFRLRDLVLSRGGDAWLPPQPIHEAQRAAAPTSYRGLLDSLLDSTPPDNSLRDRPATDQSPLSGANS